MPDDGVVHVSGNSKWGYCSSECDGQMPDPSSKFNLASLAFNGFWEENFFDLRNFGAGYCYTYNPPELTKVEFKNRFFMLLGNRKLHNKFGALFVGFEVYLHEKGQFWPRGDMQIIGQTDAIKIDKFQEIVGHFSIKRIEMIAKEGLCTDTLDYSVTKCLNDYVLDTLDCKMDLNLTTTSSIQCPVDFNLKKYLDLFLFFQHSSLKNISTVTGCLPKCKYTEYEFQREPKEGVDWKTAWMSSFYLWPKNSKITYSVEYYEFGLSDLFSDFRSYLGLFLGWSLLSITRGVPAWLSGLKETCKTLLCKSRTPDQECGTSTG